MVTASSCSTRYLLLLLFCFTLVLLSGCSDNSPHIMGLKQSWGKTELKTKEFTRRDYQAPSKPDEKPESWNVTTHDGFQWTSGRYTEGEFIWTADGQRIASAGSYDTISLMDATTGEILARTTMPSKGYIRASAAGIVVVLPDQGIKRVRGMLLLDDRTLEIKKYYSISVIGIEPSVDNEFAAIAVRQTVRGEAEIADAQQTKEYGFMLLVNLETDEVISKGQLNGRTLGYVNRGTVRDHNKRPARDGMYIVMTPDRKWIFTDGVQAIDRYKVNGDSIIFDQSFKLAEPVFRGESPEPVEDRDDFVSPIDCNNDYVRTNVGTVSTADPGTIVSTEISALSASGHVFWSSDEGHGIDFPFGTTIHRFDEKMRILPNRELQRLNVLPGPSSQSPAFLMRFHETVVIGRPSQSGQ